MASHPEGSRHRRSEKEAAPAVPRWAIALLLLALLGVALWLQGQAIRRQSFSGDAVYHLLAGHQALLYGQNTLNLEHPPLAKLVMAWPALLESEPLAPPLRVEEALVAADSVHGEAERLFRVGFRGRALTLLVFGLPLWGVVFLLGRRFGGAATGLSLTAMMALAFPVVANLSILQTDTAAALAFVLTVLAADRMRRSGSLAAAASTGLAFGLALSVKYSGVLLAPAVVAALLLPLRGRRALGSLALRLLLIAATALAVLELPYRLANRKATPTSDAATIAAYCAGGGTAIVGDHLRPLEPTLQSIRSVDPALAHWLTGFLSVAVQNGLGVYPSYALGEVSYEGRVWYFPLLLAVKLPLLLLASAVWLAVGAARRWRDGGFAGSLDKLGAPVVLTPLVYLGAAMSSNYNLGFRHLLPVLPFLLLPVARLLARRPAAAALVVCGLAAESIVLTPFWMSATNTWWLGDRNPSRFAFGAGNSEYRQNFFELAREVEERQIRGLQVLYPSLDQAVLRAYLPDARLVEPEEAIGAGWYAVNVRVEQYLPALAEAMPGALSEAAKAYREPWRQIRQGSDHGYVAATFHLYHLDGD